MNRLFTNKKMDVLDSLNQSEEWNENEHEVETPKEKQKVVRKITEKFTMDK